MKKILRELLAYSLIFALGACASKPAAPEPGEKHPVPTQPGKPADVPSAEAPRRPIVEKPHIALVLGGAGVASFATVGLLKKLNEEGIVVDFIVATGWPAVFALGYGFLRSVHDVEWFAMRLQEKDFEKAGFFESLKDVRADKVPELFQSSFKQKDLSEAKVPIIVSAANTDLGDPESYDRGDWREPLLRTLAIPGLYRPFPKTPAGPWLQSLRGMDVEEAIRRNADTVVAVQMYADYFNGASRDGAADKAFRDAYVNQLRQSLKKDAKLAQINGEIVLSKAPGDFAAKRSAILAGMKEGLRIAKALLKEKRP